MVKVRKFGRVINIEVLGTIDTATSSHSRGMPDPCLSLCTRGLRQVTAEPFSCGRVVMVGLIVFLHTVVYHRFRCIASQRCVCVIDIGIQ